MYLNSDFTKNVINLFGCDENKEESQLKAEVLTNELTKAGTFTLKVNRLYNTYGEDYKSMCDIPGFLWYFRLVDKGMMPILDKRFPTLEDLYKLMEDQGYTESDINRFKNLPDSTVKYIKKNMETVVKEGTASYDLECDNWCAWMGDKTQPAPLEAVTYWKNHTETNDWYITIDGYETQGTKEVLNDKTVEEVKARLDELVTERVGEPLTAQDVEPAEFDQYGGVIMNKSMKDSNDEDTFMVTDHLGNTVAVDGMEKALETATAYRKARAEFQLSFFIWRKITEPDGYFAWREENIADYL
tara:strand:- start:318 stop:1217 length:900 start_codon:yes stop_codon:yes gene_type:complete